MAKGKTKYSIGPHLKAGIFTVLPLALWLVLTFRYSDFLLKAESGSLFLWDWEPLVQSLAIPGGLLGWLGTFFMQFLHLPWLGSLLWTLLLAVSVPLTAKAFRIPQHLWALAAVPAFLLAAGNMSLGYTIYIMKGTGWFFTPTLGYLTAALTVLALERFEGAAARTAAIAVLTAAGFWLTGCFALYAAVLAGIMALTGGGTRQSRITAFAAGIALAVIIPLAAYPLFTTYRLQDSWTLGLPASDLAEPFRIRYAYVATAVFIALAGPLATRIPDRKSTRAMAGVTAAMLVLSWALWYSDSNFRTELAMANATDNSDWKKAAAILEKAAASAAKSDERAFAARSKALSGAGNDADRDFVTDKYDRRFFEPTRPMVLLKDLALFKLGTEGDKAFMYRDGDRRQDTPYTIPMVAQIGKQLYFNYGMPNYCHRWCIEEAVEYGWSYQNLKYMAMSAMSMEEWNVARRFLDKLSSTLFYRGWARQQLAMLGDSKAMRASAPYSDVLPLMCYEDRLSSDMAMVETYIMKHFTQYRSVQASPQFDRAALLWAMRMQDIPTFWRCLYCYLDTSSPKKMPRHYQEAAYMYSSLEKDSGMQELPYDRTVTDSYASFMKFSQSHPVRTLDESRYQYMKKFGGTFFFYYYFTRNQETF